ncbi:hypothetical protein EsH8_V_001151 [Colletotrichum jinshuiense]
MDPLWLMPDNDPELPDGSPGTCIACGDYGRHCGKPKTYYCYVKDHKAAVAGRAMAERAFKRAERMHLAAMECLVDWQEQLDHQDGLISTLREDLEAAEERRDALAGRRQAQMQRCQQAERQKMALIDVLRAADVREENENMIRENAGEYGSNFEEEMSDGEHDKAIDPHFWETETQWWDEDSDDEPEELSSQQKQHYLEWQMDYEVRKADRRSHSEERRLGRQKRKERQLYVERRMRDAEAERRRMALEGRQGDSWTMECIRAMEQEQRERRLTRVQGRSPPMSPLLSRDIQMWAAGVQPYTTPGPLVKQEEDISDVQSPAMSSRVSVKREAASEDLWRVASVAPDQADVSQEAGTHLKTETEEGGCLRTGLEQEAVTDLGTVLRTTSQEGEAAGVPKQEETDPESELMPGQSLSEVPYAPTSPAASGRPQRTTRQTRRTRPY